MHTKPRVYSVPARTPQIKLNCSVNGNPMPQVQWYFLPNDILKTKLLETNRAISSASASKATNNSHNSRFAFEEIPIGEEWKSLNLVASYSFRHVTPSGSATATSSLEENTQYIDDAAKNSSYSIIKLPLSKYQIFERRSVNHVGSTLEIKVIYSDNSSKSKKS